MICRGKWIILILYYKASCSIVWQTYSKRWIPVFLLRIEFPIRYGRQICITEIVIELQIRHITSHRQTYQYGQFRTTIFNTRHCSISYELYSGNRRITKYMCFVWLYKWPMRNIFYVIWNKMSIRYFQYAHSMNGLTKQIFFHKITIPLQKLITFRWKANDKIKVTST